MSLTWSHSHSIACCFPFYLFGFCSEYKCPFFLIVFELLSANASFEFLYFRTLTTILILKIQSWRKLLHSLMVRQQELLVLPSNGRRAWYSPHLPLWPLLSSFFSLLFSPHIIYWSCKLCRVLWMELPKRKMERNDHLLMRGYNLFILCVRL